MLPFSGLDRPTGVTTDAAGANLLNFNSNGGTLTNCTFANNHAVAGSGYFAAAIAGGQKLTIQNTLFWNNTSQDAGAPMTHATAAVATRSVATARPVLQCGRYLPTSSR